MSLGEGLLGELFIGTKYLARLESSTRSCHMFNPMQQKHGSYGGPLTKYCLDKRQCFEKWSLPGQSDGLYRLLRASECIGSILFLVCSDKEEPTNKRFALEIV